MIDITHIAQIIIALIGAIISAFVVPCIRNKISKQDMDKMLELIEIAVYAAQQLYWDKKGSERLQYVLDFLSEHGYDVDDKTVRNAIEAQVLALHESLVGDGNE